MASAAGSEANNAFIKAIEQSHCLRGFLLAVRQNHRCGLVPKLGGREGLACFRVVRSQKEVKEVVRLVCTRA